MPASEIDDIFANKGKQKVTPPAPSTSTVPKSSKKKKKSEEKVLKERSSQQEKKGKKRKREGDEGVEGNTHSSKRRVPETVVDPSLAVAPSLNNVGGRDKAKVKAPPRPPRKSAGAQKEAEERFKDSRGNGPRRTTEEGFSVYKEDELGISGNGGDTPLCPFDCHCCF